MRSPYLIGFGAGLVSAVLLASATTSTTLALALLYLSPLPTLLAGLGWGWVAAGVAAIAGTGVIILALGFVPAVIYFIGLGAPAVILCYLALLSRPQADPVSGGQPALEWYPPGRLMAWATGLAGGLVVLSMLVAGVDPDSLQASIAEKLNEIITALRQQSSSGGNGSLSPVPLDIDEEGLQRLARFLALAAPAAVSIAWLLVMVLNLMLAGRVVDASGRALRPWPDIPSMSYPSLFSIAAAISFALAFTGGALGSMATAFSGAFILAYLLLGLVIIHVLTKGMPFRSFMLAVVYLSILFLGWAALIVAMIGLCDPILRLRERMKPPPAATGSGPND